MTSPRQLILPVFALICASAAADETFPKPPELQPDVDFWLSIFTVYESDEGVLHDNRNLAVVYEKMAIPEGLSRRERQRRVAKRRNAIQAVLKSLAGGKRDNLSADEARILAMWPPDVSNSTLRSAAGRIRYQQGLRGRFREGLERAGRWRDHVNREFEAAGVPIEIAALPHVESSYNPAARSHVGASGIWQFTRSTGRRFMRVDHVLDERNDPFAATRAAARLMAYNYSLTGNWPMAITAYNHGLAGVRRAMRQFGDNAYVEILRKYKGRTFGFASRNFYVAFLAAMEVDQNAEKYFPGLVTEAPTEYASLELPSYVLASGLSGAMGVPTKKIAAHNPGLQEIVWRDSKYLPKGYTLRYPAAALEQDLAAIVSGLPQGSVFAKQLPDLFHKVRRGDTLSQIANTYETRVSTLVALNNLSNSHRIRIGQQIRLPAAGPAPVAVVAATAAEPVQEVQPEPIPEALAEPAEAVVVEAVVAEATPGAMADETAPPPETAVQTSLLSDPNDYTVAEDGTIAIHSLETLGHYGDWLEIKTQRLRDINGLAFQAPVALGQRIKLDLRKVTPDEFEERRIAYHRSQQDAFFRQHIISGVTEHTIRSGESIWILSLRRYKVPIWLFRQYNPDVDMHSVRPGTKIRFPIMADPASE